ncbi:MAG: hypothetical protein OXG03_05065 [Gammaproteobacteria bacterium]|nr:hypothetical protein [Gammaproteobacteria bacterium]
MEHESNQNFNTLSFAQREGRAPLPELMQPEHVPAKFKQLIWRVLEKEIQRESKNAAFGLLGSARIYKRHSRLEKILFRYRYEILEMPHDQARYQHWRLENKVDPELDKGWIRAVIYEGEYHETLNFIEFLIRQPECSDALCKKIKIAFDSSPIAYYIATIDNLPTIVPRQDLDSGKATRQAIETIMLSKMEGAAKHLRQAVEQIHSKQYAKSIAESIHAVESVARMIDPNANKTLGSALDSLEGTGLLKHSALKGAFKKLYGYTNDEEGIRHALLTSNSPDVGLDEAMFMFGACAHFAAYLTSKHKVLQGS